jgi:hypothetical protein
MTGGKQLLRILLALALLGFSSQDRTTLAHAVAGLPRWRNTFHERALRPMRHPEALEVGL